MKSVEKFTFEDFWLANNHMSNFKTLFCMIEVVHYNFLDIGYEIMKILTKNNTKIGYDCIIVYLE